jgi:hypothetical protein
MKHNVGCTFGDQIVSPPANSTFNLLVPAAVPGVQVA